MRGMVCQAELVNSKPGELTSVVIVSSDDFNMNQTGWTVAVVPMREGNYIWKEMTHVDRRNIIPSTARVDIKKLDDELKKELFIEE